MKYLAEHLDANGIAALFTDYQDHCVDMFFERKKWDMQKVWSSDEMRRAALGVTEHLFRELSYWATLKPILAGIPTETFDIIETFVEQYLSYAYKKNQQRFHPGGMTPMVFYREVIELYSPSGLAYKCMKIILTEHNPNGVQNPLDPDILTEFLIREYSDQFTFGTLGAFELMRQAVAEMLAGKTQDECRQMAIDTMKRVRGFSQMIYTNAVVEDMREKGYIMEAEQRERIGEWLRDVTPKTLFDEYVKKPKHHSLIWYNALYLDLLNDVGRIWAAQLLVHGIDMKDLESGVCCILNPNNTYRYYVDKYYSDDLPTQYCVSDEERAKELLNNFNTENVTNMSTMFQECSKLNNLNVKNFKTNKVTDMSYMFNECSNLNNLDVSNFNTENVTNMKAMFQECSKLNNLDVSNFKTNKVTDMSFMFNKCSNLNNLDVSNFNTENVTNMKAMFQLCSKLNNLDVSKFNTNKVTDMSFMFNKCSNLNNLDVSNFNTENVKSSKNMFYNCPIINKVKSLNNFNNLKDIY